MNKVSIHRKYYADIDGYDEAESEVNLLEAEGSSYTLEIGGKTFLADFVKTGHNLYSLIINNVSYEIDIYNINNTFDILINGDHFKVDILDELQKMLRDRVTKGLQGKQIIATPMPGLVTKVLVKKGDVVKTGDPLLILVAMKMENQIKAPKDGEVLDLFVVANQTVSVGDKLIVIE